MFGNIEWNQNTLAVVGTFSVAICAVIGGIWRAMEAKRHDSEVQRSENDLKRSMVERGMNAEEIEKVLSAGGKTKP